MSTWLRERHGDLVHVLGCCPHAGGARPWRMVTGWSDDAVMHQIAQVPWLRMCAHCATALAGTGENRHGPDGPPTLAVVQ